METFYCKNSLVGLPLKLGNNKIACKHDTDTCSYDLDPMTLIYKCDLVILKL